MQISVKLGGADVFTLGVYLFNTDAGIMDGFAAIEWDLGGFVEGDVVDLGGIINIDTSLVDDVMVQLAETDYVHTLQITTTGGVWEQDLELYDGESIRSYSYDADIPADVDENGNGNGDDENGSNLGNTVNLLVSGMIVIGMTGMMASALKEE